MREPPENMQVLCGKHAQHANPAWAKLPPEWFRNRHVKLCFPTTPPCRFATETIWVYCTGPRDRDPRLSGIVNNEPQFVRGLRFGDQVLFRREEVVAVMDPTNEQVFFDPDFAVAALGA
jgi:hypothetical protein